MVSDSKLDVVVKFRKDFPYFKNEGNLRKSRIQLPYFHLFFCFNSEKVIIITTNNIIIKYNYTRFIINSSQIDLKISKLFSIIFGKRLKFFSPKKMFGTDIF